MEYLQHNGFPFAERIALAGAADKGDVKVCPGVISEVKNCASKKLPAWFRELAAEIKNANAEHGFLLMKPEGIGRTRVGQWWAGMLVGDFEKLCIQAGDADPELDAILPGHNFLAKLPSAIAALTGREAYVAIHPRGVEDLRYWYAMTQLEHMVRLLRRAGYGSEVLS